MRTPSSFRGPTAWRVAAWKPRREEERPAGLVEAPLHQLDGRIDAHAERLEHVGAAAAPAGGAVAVLGHRDAAGRDHQRGHGGDVERPRPVAAGATGVDRRPARRVVPPVPSWCARSPPPRPRSRRARPGPREGADLRRRRFAVHDRAMAEPASSSVRRSPRVSLARCRLMPTRAPLARPIPRKFRSRSLPAAVRMLSGWNCTPSSGRSLCRRPITTPSSVQAETSRHRERSPAPPPASDSAWR